MKAVRHAVPIHVAHVMTSVVNVKVITIFSNFIHSKVILLDWVVVHRLHANFRKHLCHMSLTLRYFLFFIFYSSETLQGNPLVFRRATLLYVGRDSNNINNIGLSYGCFIYTEYSCHMSIYHSTNMLMSLHVYVLKILPSSQSTATWCIMVNVSMWCLPTTANKEWCARYYYENDKESYTFQRQNPFILQHDVHINISLTYQ